MSGYNLTSIDLFSGAGGLSEGLRVAGFQTLYANEVQPQYAETFQNNHPETIVDARDIRAVDAKLVRNKLRLKRGELDLLAGGPPCQGFSINAPVRRRDDDRNHLFKDFLRFASEFQPRAVLIENVPGLVSFSGGSTLHDILEALQQLGYAADVRILYAPHYGVPQTRWRTFVVGLRGQVDPAGAFPAHQNHAPIRVNFTSVFAGRNIVSLPQNVELSPFVSVAEAIGDLPPLKNGESSTDYSDPPSTDFQRLMRMGADELFNHSAPKLGKRNLQRLTHIPPGGNWTSIPFELLPPGMQRARQSDHTKRYGRVSAEGLASTILTKCDPHWGAYIHYDQDRVFSVREAARLQSFPDRYRFFGSRSEQYEQVGNAVPPLLARAVGAAIAQQLSQEARVAEHCWGLLHKGG